MRLLRFARNDENSKIPRDCFASLAMTKILEFLEIASSFALLTPRNDG